MSSASRGAPVVDEASARLRAMLSRPLPEIPPAFFYDDHGSALFEQITALPEYYQTRTEIGLLERHAPAMLDAARPQRLVELGSGAGRKIRLLLDAWRPPRPGATCTMFDVNASFLNASVERLAADYPAFCFDGIVGDFTRDLDRLGPGGERLTIFFGGTIGNLYPAEQHRFFETLASGTAPGDALLIGVDLVKPKARLEAAYNDARGLTAAFNRRALYGLNARYGGDFEPEAFAHQAFYDEDNAWIEMRLVARKA
ncbi:MAG: L-histidine N(alpha)-methyltransferase, partial [Myxococcales bacterium]|nr:L-histidine N(alpha)-methyltransferase [Myxococcales bacterium]